MSKATECDGKQAHATKAAALTHRNSLARRVVFARLGVYRCRHCKKFHVGNRRGTPNGRRPTR